VVRWVVEGRERVTWKMWREMKKIRENERKLE
jgi:hypothetical protein